MASIGSNSSAAAEPHAAPAPAPAHADVVVALTSYNDERTVARVARAAREGLSRYFEPHETLLVLADARSSDGTREAARAAAGPEGFFELEPQPAATLGEMPYHGHPDRGRGMRAIFQLASRLGAGACAVLDAGLENVTPEWIERLVGPVVAGEYDYVSPYYLRRVSDGALTKAIVYPMFRALYGVRLRQPAAGEFGCSGRLVTHYLAQDFWDVERVEAGIDLWLAVAAVCGGFRACEASLGPRVTAHNTPAADLSTTLAQVVGALFADLEQRVEFWQRTRGSVPIPLIGPVPPADARSRLRLRRDAGRVLPAGLPGTAGDLDLRPAAAHDCRPPQDDGDAARAVRLRRPAVGRDHLRFRDWLQPARHAARPFAAVADAALRGLARVLPGTGRERDPRSRRAAARAALPRVRSGETAPDFPVAVAGAAEMTGEPETRDLEPSRR